MQNYLYSTKSFSKRFTVFLILLFNYFGFSQSNNCAATPTLTVGTSCTTTNYNVTGTFTESGVSVSCGTSLRDGWFTFTTGPATTSITINGTSNRRLGLAVYSGACGSLTEVAGACSIPNAANANLTDINVTPNTTYRLRLMRTNGPNTNDMTGTICIFDTTVSTNFTCATATTLPCGTTSLAGTTVGSPGTPAHGSGCTMSNYGAWYTFVGDGQQTTISSTAGTGFDHEMSISSGSCGSLTNIACRDSGLSGGTESYTFTTTIGVTYYVYIAYWSSSGTSTDTGTFTISRTCTPAPTAPANDLCANATPLPCGTTNLAGTTINTTNVTHGTGCSMSNYGVWYTFVGDGQQTTISTNPSFDIKLSVATGSCGALTNIACTDTSPETATFITTNGVTYYVYVAHWSSGSTTTGNFTISRTCVPVVSPPNDNCSGAVALTVNPDLNCGATTAGSLSFATDSGVTGSGCGGTDDDDVWYSFVATSTVHHVELLNVAGSTTDLYHAVYSGTCGTLGAALVCSDPNSSIVTGLTIGNTYYIQVYSWTSTTGQNTTFDVCVGTPPPPPANDECNGAISLSVNSSCTYSTYTTSSATGSLGIPAPGCGSYSGGDVWFSVVVPTNGQIIVDTQTGGITDSGMALYSGTCGSLTLLECDDDDSANGAMSLINYSGLTPGSTVYIRVWEYGNDNPGTFGICVTTPPCGSPFPSNINVTVTSDTTATLTWTAVTPAPASGYDYYISTSSTAPTAGTTPTGSTAAGVTTVNLTGLTAGETYYVWVRSDCGGGSGSSAWSSETTFTTPVCSAFGPGTGTSTLGCPSVISGGLGLNGADPSPINCTAMSTCVDLEATYLDLGDTSSYTVSSIPYNPPYQFNCLRNPVSVNIDDRWSPLVNLPFDFCFYGNSYNQCLIGSNGVITFDTTNNTPGGTCNWSFDANLPVAGDSSLIENAIFGVFHDINPGVGGEVGWELITLNTGCRALVASWYDVPLFGDNTQSYTGMMVLYENTNVIEVYIQSKPNDPGDWNDNNAVVGIQNATGTVATVAPGRNGLSADWTATNEAWRFTPSGTSITSLTWYEGSGTSGPIVGTTDTINVCPTATTTYTAAITYTLCDGSTLIETEETTVTINGSKVWNGSVNTDWDNDNNWTPVGKPTALDCVVIPDTANDPIISGTGYNGLGLNLSIQNDAVLSVNTDNSVTITDWVNISATGELFLDNAASLIQTNNVANSGTGAMHMERDVNIRRLDYVYWSSPVTNFASSAISPNTPTGVIWKWTPTVSGNGTGNSGDWVNGNENMTVGKGYIVRGPSTFNTTLQNFTATFVGTPNNGNISIPITRGNYTAAATYQVCATCTPATNLDDNWNLVGNPYPSAIDAIDFLTANPSIDGYIKIWTHGTLPTSAIADPFYEDFVYNYTIGDYITYNSSGSSSGPGVFNGYIAAGQGFFVSMLDGGSATKNLNFTNSLRSNTYDNGQFFRNANVEKNRIWLDIIDGQNRSTRTLVGYIDGATNETDRLFDAKTDNKIDLNLFSLIENETYMIQGKALPFDDNDVIPLGFKVPSNGIYTIAIGALDGIFENTNQNIYLEDKELNIIYNLREAQYSFVANEGTNSNRFNLIFKNVTKHDPIDTENTVWVSTENSLTIHSNIQNIKSVRVFDLLGRVLTNKENISSKNILLDKVMKNNTGLILEIVLENNQTIYKKTIY